MLDRRKALLNGLAGVVAAGGMTDAAAQTAEQSVTYVVFTLPINGPTIGKLMSAMVSIQTSEIYLIMSTTGGEVPAGIFAHNFLKSLPRKLTTHNISSVDSIGNAVFLAGKQRMASAHSTFLFHGLTRSITSPALIPTNTLAEWLEGSRADEKKIADIIKENTKLSVEQATRFFQQAATMDAAAALDAGIIDKVQELQIRAGAPVVIVQG
jgi:ATP-dependent Clp protease, protease subunit